MSRNRFAAWLAGLWAGVLLGVAFIGAPAAFATLPVDAAGRTAGRMFAVEANLSVLLSVVMFMLLRVRASQAAREGAGSVLSADMLLVLGALFCTIAGYYALQPMMAAARLGQGHASFAVLHGASMAFYALKTLCIAALAWRLAPR